LQSFIHTTPSKPATVIGNLTATGPPPTAPLPNAEYADIRLERRKRQAALLKKNQDLKSGGSSKQKRFWKDVVVKSVDGEPSTP
jgi:ATP synthase F1 complex assembly factor 2